MQYENRTRKAWECAPWRTNSLCPPAPNSSMGENKFSDRTPSYTLRHSLRRQGLQKACHPVSCDCIRCAFSNCRLSFTKLYTVSFICVRLLSQMDDSGVRL